MALFKKKIFTGAGVLKLPISCFTIGRCAVELHPEVLELEDHLFIINSLA